MRTAKALLRRALLRVDIPRGWAACALALVLAAALVPAPARALEPIVIDTEQDRVDITVRGQLYEGRGDWLQVEAAPGPDGIASRMAVQASTPGTNPSWIVFALKNPTNKTMERWLTAERYSIIGSQVFWPDVDSGRIAAITPSLGFRPERVPNDRADIFRVTLEPGAIVTLAVELSTVRVPRLFLWRPLAYEVWLQDRMLFNGIMLGIVGLLAIFLTSVFAANHKSVFPAAALIAWSALAWFCIDFGFWHKLFQVSAEDNATSRAAAEAAFAASLVIFLYAFLRVRLWHTWIKFGFWGWILAHLSLIAFAVVDPRLAMGLARASLPVIGVIGSLLIAYLAIRGQERALSLVPTWLLVLVWIFGAAMVVLGRLSGDVAVSGLISGLVLLIVLLGFTVTQYAFRTGEPLYGAPPSKLQQHALALEGADASVWEWSVRRDEVRVSEDVADALDLPPGMLNGSAESWRQHLHPADRERFRQLLAAVRDNQGGELNTEIRLRRADGSYLWFELKAQSMEGVRHGDIRCIGLMRDVTGIRRTQERLMHDAVHDSLTGLPNRELFLDRLGVAVTRAREGEGARPTVLLIDLDRFKNVNRSLGLVVGDSMLLTVARRLARHLNPQDSLARIGGDQFTVLLVSEFDPQHTATLAEQILRSLRSPMKIAGKEIILTGSIGIAVYDGKQENPEEVFREAEIAMFRAKRSGADRIEVFRPDMRGDDSDRLPLESELRRALEREQIKVHYQPIMRLSNNSLAGFEALLRWDHPRHGRLSPDDFIPIAEETGLIGELGAYVLEQAVAEAVRWQEVLPRDDHPLFVSINVSSRQLFRQDLVQQIRLILSRGTVPKHTLWLEVTESLVMENPEQAVEIMNWLKSFGAHLSLDDFGTGYSSLSYLHRFPVDTIKVDRSLVRDSGPNSSAPVILKSIVALAHELGKDVVAEGVESEADASYLRSIACEYAQGFYYGEPMSAKDVMSLLNALAKAKRKDPKREDTELFEIPRLAPPMAEDGTLTQDQQALPPPEHKPATSPG